MHPVARFNLGKGRKVGKIQIQIDGDDGNGDTLHFEPNPAYTFWKNVKNLVEVDISKTTRIYLRVVFVAGASGEYTRSLTDFAIYAPSDSSFNVVSSSPEFKWAGVRSVPPAILKNRGLDSDYKSYNFTFIDQSLVTDDYYNRTFTISMIFNNKPITLEIHLSVG